MKQRNCTCAQRQCRNKSQDPYERGLQKGRAMMAALVMSMIHPGTTLDDIYMLCKQEVRQVYPDI